MPIIINGQTVPYFEINYTLSDGPDPGTGEATLYVAGPGVLSGLTDPSASDHPHESEYVFEAAEGLAHVALASRGYTVATPSAIKYHFEDERQIEAPE